MRIFKKNSGKKKTPVALIPILITKFIFNINYTIPHFYNYSKTKKLLNIPKFLLKN